MARGQWQRRFCFDHWSSKEIDRCLAFAEDYRRFLTENKTEREVVATVRRLLQQRGFEEISFTDRPNQNWRQLFLVNRDRALILARRGQQPVSRGLRLIVAHIDSPRIDLKLLPLYEEEHLAFFKTHFYGGIKTYQWVALPLELRGVVIKPDGRRIEIKLGQEKGDPVLMITDLLPHLAEKQFEKKLKEAIEGEQLNVLVGSRARKKGKKKVKAKILDLLRQKYQIEEEDFVSADLELVPAGPARDLGLDASFIAGYGHDDRVCAWTALQAALAVDDPPETSVIVLVDREEIGSMGNTGATSSFVRDFIANLVAAESGRFDENQLRDTLAQSRAISADVTAGLDPNYAEVSDPVTAVRLGAGIALEKTTAGRGKGGGNEASAEFLAEIRRIWNQADIIWQPTSSIGKIDLSRGGTVSWFFAQHNIEVVDAGVPLFNMHAPFEIAHKGDIYAAYLAYRAFLAH